MCRLAPVAPRDPAVRPDPATLLSWGHHPERTGPTGISALWQRSTFSALAHAALVVVAVAVARHAPPVTTETVAEAARGPRLVWTSEAGPGGGGGGGGNNMPLPARRAQAPGHDALTVPVQQAATPTMPTIATQSRDLPPSGLVIPAELMGDSNTTVPGAIEGSGSTFSQGPGGGGGSGIGHGGGGGPGYGVGLGPGKDRGSGGGDVYQPGSGVEPPVHVIRAKPQYTAEAMRAKIQGSVFVECVVRVDGSVGDIRVVRSLDPVFGLDQEAVKAARRWRFLPGRRHGMPVPVLISIQLDFNMR